MIRKGVPETPISTGLIRFSDMAECHVVYSEKPNAILFILDAFLRFGPQIHQSSTDFIMYSEQHFSVLQDALGPMLF